MKLSEIIANIKSEKIDNFKELNILNVSSDSREKLDNSIFVGVKGLSGDGAAFADQAIDNGASVVVYETEVESMQEGIVYLKVEDSRAIQSVLAAMVYGYPAKSLKTIAVTGTNGKTSFAYILRHILNFNNEKCGLLGTTEYDLGARIITPTHTTPDAVFVHRYLKEMVESGCSFLVMEVSSHALALGRVKGLKYDISVFTNLSQDHLDFHHNMDNYAYSKSHLFSDCSKKEGISILNADDSYSTYFSDKCIGLKKFYSVMKDKNADLLVEDFRYRERGLQIDFLYKGKTKIVSTNLFGDFQVYNVTAAILAALKLGFELEAISKALEQNVLIPGRLESIKTPKGSVFVDYAHTADALLKAICSLKGIPGKKITTIFGCGGDRDQSKRSEMGKVAVQNSHKVIITSDNPRFEDPALIIKDVVQDLNDFQNYTVLENRAEAILSVLENCTDEDIILIAGKGHETYQEIKGVKYPFSDKEVVLKYFNKEA